MQSADDCGEYTCAAQPSASSIRGQSDELDFLPAIIFPPSYFSYQTLLSRYLYTKTLHYNYFTVLRLASRFPLLLDDHIFKYSLKLSNSIYRRPFSTHSTPYFVLKFNTRKQLENNPTSRPFWSAILIT